MMFYICSSDDGVFTCTTSFREAKDLIVDAEVNGLDNCIITACNIPVTAESIRLILSEAGGYATSTRIYSYWLSGSSKGLGVVLKKEVKA